jgi:hypothetical protein
LFVDRDEIDILMVHLGLDRPSCEGSTGRRGKLGMQTVNHMILEMREQRNCSERAHDVIKRVTIGTPVLDELERSSVLQWLVFIVLLSRTHLLAHEQSGASPLKKENGAGQKWTFQIFRHHIISCDMVWKWRLLKWEWVTLSFSTVVTN